VYCFYGTQLHFFVVVNLMYLVDVCDWSYRWGMQNAHLLKLFCRAVASEL